MFECDVSVGSRILTGIGGSTFANSFNARVKASPSVSLKPWLLVDCCSLFISFDLLSIILMMFGIAERHGILVDNCIDNIYDN